MDIIKELEAAAAALVSAGRYEDAAAVVTAGNQMAELEAQRDGLVAALEGMCALYRQRADHDLPIGHYAEEANALSALASVKSGEAVTAPQPQPVPHPAQEMDRLIDDALRAENWPCNPKEAARVGFRAAMLAAAPQPPAQDAIAQVAARDLVIQQMREALEFSQEKITELHIEAHDGEFHYPIIDDALSIQPTTEAMHDWLKGHVGEPIFHFRPCCGGEMYEGPHHNNSAMGKMLRDEKPGEWKPLYRIPALEADKS